MKIIDKTPFQNELGEIEFSGRVQGTLKYGGNWYAETLAQKVVIDQLGLLLEKGFVLIRNFNLPGSEIIVPITLLGPHGISIIYVTHLKGHFEAKGDEWNRLDQGRSIPEKVNVLNRAVRLARATQIYLDRQGINLPTPVTPVLMAAYPGLQIESMRPVARVVMSDAIKQYASSLLQGRPMLRSEQVYDLADRMMNPHEPEPMPFAPTPAQAPAPESGSISPETPAPARARAIFDAAQSAPAFDPSDLSFAFGDEAGTPAAGSSGSVIETSPSQSLKRTPSRRVLGMKPMQFGCLALLAIVECCVLAGAGYYFMVLQP
ncbi:MAG TPA: hypothetical protein VIV15_11890 [Anaerolineales bacterium]